MLAIIPVKLRSGSCPLKNVRPLAGIPMFLHSVAYCRREGIRHAVATIDPEIMELCKEYDVPVFSGEPVGDQAGPLGILKAAAYTSSVDNEFALIQPTSPFRTPCLLHNMLDDVAEKKLPGMYTVQKIKLQGQLIQGDKTTTFNAPPRQVCTNWVMPCNGNIFVLSREAIEKQTDLLSDGFVPVIQDGFNNLDIDTEEDFKTAEQIAKIHPDELEAYEGLRIAVVSNKPCWNRDLSEEINSHDLVVRINDLTSIDSQQTGTRCDIAVILPGTNYLANLASTQHGDVLRKCKKIVFARQNELADDCVKRIKEVVERHNLPRNWVCEEEILNTRFVGHTTFFEAGVLMQRFYPKCSITMFGDKSTSRRAIEHMGSLADIEDAEIESLTEKYQFKWMEN